MVLSRRAWRRRAGRLRSNRLRCGRGGLRIANEDLCSGRESAVVGRQVDVETDDEPAMTSALRRILVGHGLLEHDGVAPVAERDLLVRRRGDARAEHDQVRDRRIGELSARLLGRGARHRLRGERIGGHLPAEKRDRPHAHDRTPDGAIVVDGPVRPSRDRPRRDRSVTVRPAHDRGGRLRRRRDRSDRGGRLAGNDDADAE